MTDIDGDLLDDIEDLLRTEASADSPLTSGEIADRLGIDDSEANPTTREAIRLLAEERKVPTVGAHNGYYIIETEAQKEEYLASLRQRIAGIEERIWLIERAWQAQQGRSQTTLAGAGGDD